MPKFLRHLNLALVGFAMSFAFAIYAELPALAEEIELQQITFSDLKEENMNYVPILSIAREGYINGYEDGTFQSWKEINRAEALKITMKFLQIFDENKNSPAEKPFKDVEIDAWYAPYIQQAKDKGIANGYEDGTFRPEEQISLAEALKLIIESIESYGGRTPTEDPFADVPMTAWFAQYAEFAKEREMVNITPENKINPEELLTRGQFSALIYKLQETSKGSHFGKATFYGAAVQGSGTASGEIFDMNQFTAAHKTLPFGTVVEVKNLANGKTVQVRITDRGPYGPGRVLDLTSGAFKEISELHRGVINVEYKVVEPEIVDTENKTNPSE